jgi:hypothetical protein
MGMPFPIGMHRLADSAPEFIPWAWGINGFASVISASMATLLAIEFGFTVVVSIALAAYATAAAIIGWSSEDRPSQVSERKTSGSTCS